MDYGVQRIRNSWNMQKKKAQLPVRSMGTLLAVHQSSSPLPCLLRTYRLPSTSKYLTHLLLYRDLLPTHCSLINGHEVPPTRAWYSEWAIPKPTLSSLHSAPRKLCQAVTITCLFNLLPLISASLLRDIKSRSRLAREPQPDGCPHIGIVHWCLL